MAANVCDSFEWVYQAHRLGQRNPTETLRTFATRSHPTKQSAPNPLRSLTLHKGPNSVCQPHHTCGSDLTKGAQSLLWIITCGLTFERSSAHSDPIVRPISPRRTLARRSHLTKGAQSLLFKPQSHHTWKLKFEGECAARMVHATTLPTLGVAAR